MPVPKSFVVRGATRTSGSILRLEYTDMSGRHGPVTMNVFLGRAPDLREILTDAHRARLGAPDVRVMGRLRLLTWSAGFDAGYSAIRSLAQRRAALIECGDEFILVLAQDHSMALALAEALAAGS